MADFTFLLPVMNIWNFWPIFVVCWVEKEEEQNIWLLEIIQNICRSDFSIVIFSNKWRHWPVDLALISGLCVDRTNCDKGIVLCTQKDTRERERTPLWTRKHVCPYLLARKRFNIVAISITFFHLRNSLAPTWLTTCSSRSNIPTLILCSLTRCYLK